MAAKILITAPRKPNDATVFTFEWAQNYIHDAKSLKYDILTLEKDDVTRTNFIKVVKEFKPNVVLHVGHGCQKSLQGNYQCFLNQKYSLDQLVKITKLEMMKEEKGERNQRSAEHGAERAPDGAKRSRERILDPCHLSCLYNSNIEILKDTIVIAIACNSAAPGGLGEESIRKKVQAYVGFKDLLMFAYDTMGTHNEFGNLYGVLWKEFLMGHSLKDSDVTLGKEEDKYIRANKHIKYISLLALWNKLQRRLLGNKNVMIYQNSLSYYIKTWKMIDDGRIR